MIDIVCSVLFAMITFFAALVIMDGHLHPILFGGMSIGFAFVHFLCGHYIAYAVRVLRNVCGSVLIFVRRILSKVSVKRTVEQKHRAESSDIP